MAGLLMLDNKTIAPVGHVQRGTPASSPRETYDNQLVGCLMTDVRPERPAERLDTLLYRAQRAFVNKGYSDDRERARDLAKWITDQGFALAARTPTKPRTERMDLHDELDRRFPMIKDFKAFVRGGAPPEDAPGWPWHIELEGNDGYVVARRDGETAPWLGVFWKLADAEAVCNALNGVRPVAVSDALIEAAPPVVTEAMIEAAVKECDKWGMKLGYSDVTAIVYAALAARASALAPNGPWRAEAILGTLVPGRKMGWVVTRNKPGEEGHRTILMDTEAEAMAVRDALNTREVAQASAPQKDTK